MRVVDDAEFGDFVAERGSALLRTAFLLTGDRLSAEDLLQAALERLYRRWMRRGIEHPEAYARQVMANLATDRWRRLRVVRELPRAQLPEVAVADETNAVDTRQLLWRELMALPVRQRAVLVMRYWENLSEAETATVLRCSPGTVKSQASRGLKRLRESLTTGQNTGAADGHLAGN